MCQCHTNLNRCLFTVALSLEQAQGLRLVSPDPFPLWISLSRRLYSNHSKCIIWWALLGIHLQLYRTVLLLRFDSNFTVRVCDGALSQEFYPECYHQVYGAVRPVRWAAIETLQEGLCSVQSNVVRKERKDGGEEGEREGGE